MSALLPNQALKLTAASLAFGSVDRPQLNGKTLGRGGNLSRPCG